MKTNLALLSLLVIPSFAFAGDRPDGILGTDCVTGYGLYENQSYKGIDYDYAGAGISVNQHVYNGSEYGFDVGGGFSYETNQTGGADENYQYRSFAFDLTVYKKGVMSPFFTLASDWSNMKVNSVAAGPSHHDYTNIGAKAGVECHLLPGWYVTPFIAYYANVANDNGDSSSETSFDIKTGYWFTERFGVFVQGGYEKSQHVDILAASAGVTVHY